MTPRRVRDRDQVLGVPALAPVLEHLERFARQELELAAVRLAGSTLISLEGAREQLAVYQRAGVDLDLAERAIAAGLPTATVIDVLRTMEVQTVKERELPAPTVEDLKAFAECKAEKEEGRGGKWRGQGHKGQAGRAVEKRRRRAKLARASRRRR